MAQLQFKNVTAPNLSGTANILEQASQQLTGALSGGAKILADYTKGQQDKADGKVVAEIAKLSTEDEILNFLNSDTVQGKPLSPAMQQAVLGLRKNLVGLQSDRASIQGTKANTASTIGKEGRAVESAPLENALLERQAEAIESNTSLDRARGASLEANIAQTLRRTQSIDLEDQMVEANIAYRNAQTDEQRVNASTAMERIQTELDKTRADTANVQTGTAGDLIRNQYIARNAESGLANDAVGRDSTRASTRNILADAQNQEIQNLTQSQRDQLGLKVGLANVQGANARTQATLVSTQNARNAEKRTGVRFNDDQAARIARLGDEADLKGNKLIRAQVAYKYATDPEYADRDSMLRALSQDPKFKGMSPNEIVQTANQAVALVGTPLGTAYNPKAALTLDEQQAIQLGNQSRQTEVEVAQQTRLFNDTEGYKENPQTKLISEFDIKDYVRPDDLRKEINRIASVAGVTPEQAAVSLRENYEGPGIGDYLQEFVSFVSPESIFNSDAAVQHAKDNFSPEASARNDERRVTASFDTKRVQKIAGELKVLRDQERAIVAKGGTPSAALLTSIQAKQAEMLSFGSNPVPTPAQASPTAASSILNQTVAPQPTAYEPWYADDGTAAYVDQLEAEEAARLGLQ